MTDRSEWGRVDEAGTVWVRTADGEREVGSYPGASPEDALNYFGRKYDELVAQVALLEQRVASTDLAVKDASAGIERLRELILNANAVGDLAALEARVVALGPLLEQRKNAAEQAKTAAREQARERKAQIVAEAEELATSSSWKTAGERLRVLLEEWKAAPRLERAADDELWKRFSAARNAFDRHRRAHFAALDEQRDEAKRKKEALVARAEELSTSTEWGPTAGKLRDLMTEWKAAGRAGKADEDQLWQRFRAAQDRFFDARSAANSARDSSQRENLAAKEKLVSEAEALLPVKDIRAARAALRGIQERWESIGHVPRDARPGLEGRLKAVEDALRSSEESRWRRSNPEARARAEATVAQLQSSIASLQTQLERARQTGDERKAAEAQAGLQARRSWLEQAERALTEFGGRRT